jgi:hypothetical protein
MYQEHRRPWAVVAICVLVFVPALGLLLEFGDGKIRRGRVYTDRPTHDGFCGVRFAHDINPLADRT